MNTQADVALAARIEETVRAVPGVVTVYRPGSLAARAVAAGAAALAGLADPSSLVHVERTAQGLRVEAALGVHEPESAVSAMRDASAAVLALLSAPERAVAEVVLTVVHVETRLGSAGESASGAGLLAPEMN
ncbi:hypothetical protein EDF60_1744 [Leucobacter luti]|uniref:hypothetical protein n=1 Tax=Leucobacter luti TaxID=340320 RepID=UPI00104D4064|nr:hypothetical protein [Leucobacter luti]MCW2287094.1 hypothetical protein [Leucobacter luti]TCK41318.1 hypothetical protein EDF60_1744 [Leucobacter luti]